MYPRDFFDSYWRPKLRDAVFVAMPFHDEFTPVWLEAIQPAVDVDLGRDFKAERVDATVLSGSIVTRILDGIAHARLVLADISIAREGKWKGQRNGNVMYEVGLAHASRQAAEVLLIRSDAEEINFDLAGVRVHSYDPSDLPAARTYLSRLIHDSLGQIEQSKGLQVQKVIDALDADALVFVRTWGKAAGFHGPEPANMGGALLSITKAAALARLQALGVVRCEPTHSSGKPAFLWTEFGKAVVARLGAA